MTRYRNIEIDGNDENEFQVIGELVKVLPKEEGGEGQT